MTDIILYIYKLFFQGAPKVHAKFWLPCNKDLMGLIWYKRCVWMLSHQKRNLDKSFDSDVIIRLAIKK